MVNNNQPICKIDKEGTKRWRLNNLPHREDGPAAEYIDEGKEWWVDGDQIQCSSQKEFKRLLKLKALW